MKQQQLQRYLARTAARQVRLRLTDSRRAVLSVQAGADRSVGVTLHGLFLDAPARVLRALAGFVQTPEPARRRQVIKLYRQTGLDRTGDRNPEGRTVTLRHAGEKFDLKEIYDHLNAQYFGGEVHAFITWGRRSARRGRRSIHFGSYNWERRLIRLNPLLDRPCVARYFVESIVYHEMLHAALGVRTEPDGRRSAHTREFQRRERLFRHWRRAREWELKNLHRFLRSR
jgi:hypothetical protein